MSYQNTYFTQEELQVIKDSSFSTLLQISIDFFKKHWSKLFLKPSLTILGINIVLGIVFMVIFGILLFAILGQINLEITNITYNSQLASGFIFVGILSLIFYFAMIFVQLILQFRSLELLNNNQITSILKSKNMHWNAIGVVAIYMVIYFGVLLMFGGNTDLVLLPTIILTPISIIFSHSANIALFEKLDPQIAISQGFEMFKNNIGSILKNILGIIATFIAYTLGFLLISTAIITVGFLINSTLGSILVILISLAFGVYLFCLGSVIRAFGYIEFLKYRLAMTPEIEEVKKLD